MSYAVVIKDIRGTFIQSTNCRRLSQTIRLMSILSFSDSYILIGNI